MPPTLGVVAGSWYVNQYSLVELPLCGVLKPSLVWPAIRALELGEYNCICEVIFSII